jgi:16S rRNA (cytosine1402-N4)-methyltransferase
MEHVSVLLRETIDWLAVRPGQVIVDGTLGAGGHTRAIAEQLGDQGYVIALDRDTSALAAAEVDLAGLPVKLAHANYCELKDVLDAVGIEKVDGIVLDLGLSSDQLADESRGFSFDAAGPLDLRFDATQGEPAARLIERLGEQQLADLIFKFGEERFSRRIARAIVQRVRSGPAVSAAELAQIVRKVVPRKRDERIDPATRTFQALRIAVNEELLSLETALARLPELLRPGGRLVIISFHSLEDRLVKHAFREDLRLNVLTRKPIRPSEAEIAANPRSRSAKMRVAERVLV